LRFAERVLRVGKDINNLNRFAFQRRAADGCPAARRDRMAFVKRLEFRRIVVIRDALIAFTFTTKYQTTLSFAQSDRRFDQRI